MIPCSPGYYSSITNQQNNTPGVKSENGRCSQLPYTDYTPYYVNRFGNFQEIQTLQSQNPLQNGDGQMTIPQSTTFVQPYVRPIQNFSQINMQSIASYNAFTPCGNPFGIVWRPN